MTATTLPAQKNRIKINFYPESQCILLYRNRIKECKIFGATTQLVSILEQLIKEGDYNTFVSTYGEVHITSWLINVISLDPEIANHFSKVVVKILK